MGVESDEKTVIAAGNENAVAAAETDDTAMGVESDEKTVVTAGNENAVATAETDDTSIGVGSENKAATPGNDDAVAAVENDNVAQTMGNGNEPVAAEEDCSSGSKSEETAVNAEAIGITVETVEEDQVAGALDTENTVEATAEDSIAAAVETENTTETIAKDSVVAPVETDNTMKATAKDSDDVAMETYHTVETTAEDGVLLAGEADNTMETIVNDQVMITMDENNTVGTEDTIGEDQVMVTLEANDPLETVGAEDGSIVSFETGNPVMTMEADADVAKMEAGNTTVAVEAENGLIALEADNAIIPATDMEAEYAIVPATPATPEDDDDPTGFELQPNKRRRKKSIVWEHFTVETIGPGHTRACCKHCKKSFAYITGSKLAGTSHLKRHIALGICPVSRQKNQLSPYTPSPKIAASGSSTDRPKRRYRLTPAPASIPLDQERCSHEIAKMIILHDYPLHIVEHSGFVDFVRTIQPQYNMASFNTVQGDIVAIYLREKQKLLNIVSGIPGRVSLTLDLWTSNQNLGYVFITGHFIGNDWRIYRQILNVVMIPFPDADNAFNQAVVASLSDWNLESKLFTLTVDQFVCNNNHLANLRGLLALKNPHILDGQLLIGNCYARVLSRLAQDALGSMAETIKKIRDCVKNVKTSEAHDERFDELKQRLQVPSTKELLIDDVTKWDTTYRMLVAACELKEVFSCFDTSDPDYALTPSMDEWKQVETLCFYLKILYDAAKILTGPTYPTTNTFFHEVTRIQLDLAYAAMSEDLFVSSLIKPLKDKFDRFWKQTCLVLAIAVVMDPRFKMKLVEFSFVRIFGEDAEAWIRTVDDGIHELFLEYLSPTPLPFTATENGNEAVVKAEAPGGGVSRDKVSGEELAQGGTFISFGDGLSDFDVYISEITSGQPTKSELDQYLEESLMPRVQDFDVLGWWKMNNMKFPTLSKMAADILAMPISTVRPDAVFDTGSGKIDGYRSSLRPVTLEALICAKDWLKSDTSGTTDALVKVEC